MPELSRAHESGKLEDSTFTVITASDMEAGSSYSMVKCSTSLDDNSIRQ